MRLQDELAGTENRVAVERTHYNDTLQDYDTISRSFPTTLETWFFGEKSKSLRASPKALLLGAPFLAEALS